MCRTYFAEFPLVFTLSRIQPSRTAVGVVVARLPVPTPPAPPLHKRLCHHQPHTMSMTTTLPHRVLVCSFTADLVVLLCMQLKRQHSRQTRTAADFYPWSKTSKFTYTIFCFYFNLSPATATASMRLPQSKANKPVSQPKWSSHSKPTNLWFRVRADV